MTMFPVGFSGQKRCGKDTAATALTRQGWRRVAFADRLKQCLETLNPIIGDDSFRLSDAFNQGHTWETLKTSPWAEETRRLLQTFGTDVGRNLLCDTLWLDVMPRDNNLVIPDVRFSNEAQWVRDRGGIIIHIQRPATDQPNPTHTSEVIDFAADATIINDGTVNELLAAVQETVRKHRNG